MDSLITRLLEGECGARPAAGRGRLAQSPVPLCCGNRRDRLSRPEAAPEEGRRGWLTGVGGAASGNTAGDEAWLEGLSTQAAGRGPLGSVPADLRDRHGDARASGYEESRGAGWPFPRRLPGCVLLRIVGPWKVYFLSRSLCALPLAASDSSSGSDFIKQPSVDDGLICSVLLFYVMLYDQLHSRRGLPRNLSTSHLLFWLKNSKKCLIGLKMHARKNGICRHFC